jgi:hypothetical protein
MDVFISWSGERSRAAAEALRDWLPKIINALKPWLSVADIDKGARWGTEIATKLKDSKAGIICLTPNNLHSDWLLFEAGALSKTIENTYVCPFLIGLEPADVKPPLAQFQATRATKKDVLKLLKTLNTALGEGALPAAHIEEAFDVWWPKLDERLKALPDDLGPARSVRSERDLLEEILALVRNQSRAIRTTERVFAADPVRMRLRAKLREALSKIDPKATVGGALSAESRYSFSVQRGDGRRYTIVIPKDVPAELAESIIVAQLHDATNDPDEGVVS